MNKIHIDLAAERVGTFLGMPITNTLLMAFISMAVLLIISLLIRRKASILPGRLQTIFEMLIGGVYDYIKETLESEELAQRFYPLILTIFLFILTVNWLEFIPGVGSVGFFGGKGGEFTPLFRAASTDLNFTLALTLIAFCTIEFAGAKTLGFSYLKKFVNLKSPLQFSVGAIDLFSEMARLISFSFRLFGNIFAGEVIIAVIIYFIPVIAPIPIILFEVFVGFIQAAIFALLTLFFIKIAVSPSH